MATRVPSQPARPVAASVAGLLVLLAAYGLWSMPGLIVRWGWSDAAPLVLAGWFAAALLAVPLHQRPPRGRILAACIAAAITLRLVTALIGLGRAPEGDAASYLTLARNLQAGQGLGLVEPYIGGLVRGLYPPAYALILAGWGSVAGLSTLSLSMLSLAIDGAAAFAIARLGRAIDRPGAGRAAAWLYLIWPATLFSAPLAQKESLCVLLIVTLAVLWIEGVRAPTKWRVAAIGVMAALLALTQPGEVPIAFLFGLAMVPQAGLARVLRVGPPAAIIAAVLMTPWWVRNWLVFHQFVPLTSAGALGLWIGNNPGATGNWMAPPPAWRGLPEIAYGAHAAGVARDWIMTHPGDFVRLSVAKLLRTLGVAQAGLVRLDAMRPAPSPAMLAALLPVAQLTHVALLGSAAWTARTSSRGNGVLFALIVACFAQMLGFGLWFEFAERHREFATPFLLLFAIIGLETLQTWRGGTVRPRAGLTFSA